MASLNKNSIEYRVSIGELPNPEEVRKYYLEEGHSYNEAMEHFNFTRKSWTNYINKYDIKKGTDPCAEAHNEKEAREEAERQEKIEAQEIINQASEVRMFLDENNGQTDKEKKARFDLLVSKYEGNYSSALFRFCYEYNLFYDSELAIKLIEQDKAVEELPFNYIQIIQEDSHYIDKTFFNQLKQENFEKIYSEDLICLFLTADDKKNRQQCIEIMGYDPFKNEKREVRAQLYRDLTDLITEGMRKDAAKKKAAIEIVKNYLSISIYRQKARDIIDSGDTDPETQKALDQIQSVISKIQASINQTTKENGFSGSRTIGSSGRGGLSEAMEQIEARGYDKGITNFYDIETSKSIQEIAKISNQALLNQVRLSKTDYADILIQQNLLVHEAQDKARKAVEEARLAKSKVAKQELLMELEKELREKGIEEEEIEEFINNEYDLFEIKN